MRRWPLHLRELLGVFQLVKAVIERPARCGTDSILNSSILPHSHMYELGYGTGAIRDDALYMSLGLTRNRERRLNG